MRFESETSYVGPLDLVVEVLGSQELMKKRAKAARFGGDVGYDGSSMAHTVTLQMSGSEMPAAVRSFLSGGMKVQLTGSVTKHDQSGNVRGASLSYDVAVSGAPASGKLTFILADGGATTPAKIVGDINVKVPFVGGRVERAAVEHVGKVLDRDADIVNAEVARRRGAETGNVAPQDDGADQGDADTQGDSGTQGGATDHGNVTEY